jgi:hypothetical protein
MAINLVKNDSTQKLEANLLFQGDLTNQMVIDSLSGIFNTLLFYRGLLYNPDTHAYLMAIYVNKDVFNSPKRTAVVNEITKLANAFQEKQHTEVRLSGLPLIRTAMAVKVADELKVNLKISYL